MLNSARNARRLKKNLIFFK